MDTTRKILNSAESLQRLSQPRAFSGRQLDPESNKLTETIIGAAIKVHRALGPGLLESAYQECLCHELASQGVAFQREVPVPVTYESVRLDCGYRIDLLVAESVVVEIKAIEEIAKIHEAQLLTYLKLSGKRIGLLINFNVRLLKDGIVRRVV